MRGALLSLLILGLAPHVDARASRARASVERALDALGGRDRIQEIAMWEVEGRGRENLSAELQGLTPDEPTWRPHEERVGIDTRTFSVAWHRRTPRNDGSLRFRRMIEKPDASGFVDFVANVGRMRASSVPESHRRGFSRRLPHLLLLEAATRATSLRFVEEREIEGRLHEIVAVALPGDVELTLSLSKEPPTLASASYRRHMPTLGDVGVCFEWYGWKPDEALGFVPEGHRVEVDGTLFQEVRYSRYSGAEVSPAVESLLEIPPEMTVSTPTPAPTANDAAPDAPPLPATGEVAPGVHVAEVEWFTVMFVEFRDFVVALEAPEAHPGLETIPSERVPPRISEAYLELIRDTAPEKPVRYVVMSHHHSDHMGGLRSFAAASAVLVVAPSHEQAARRALARPHTIVPDHWEGSPGDARIETVADERVITDGSRELVIINAGANPHTDENLFAWLPEERILFQGDLFYYAEGVPFPPPGRETMNRFFTELLHERGIEPRAVYGMHNRGAAGASLLR